MEEEENAQVEVQEEKDEAQVKVDCGKKGSGWL